MGGVEHYARLPSFVLGFHGCDQHVAESIFRGDAKDLKLSQNDYDWLGSGVYFWENNYRRAMDWATAMVGKPRRSSPPIRTPAVIGAVIDLGNCLNFLDQEAIELAKDRYDQLVLDSKVLGTPIPKNINPPRMVGSPDRIYRQLDRAVIEAIHQLVKSSDEPAFDSVRAVFLEGQELYPEAGFLEKTHIQLCVRNQKQVLGYFRPRVS